VSTVYTIAGAREEPLVVRVEDQINPTLAGRTGASYESPPQPREQALTLASLLLGHPVPRLDGAGRWSCPVAGGRRTVTLAGSSVEKE
jgi:hypothetical protein